MKADLEVPAAVPRKRRAIETAPDYFIAVWLARDDLPSGDRKRLEAEKARRRSCVTERTVGVVLDAAGVEPAQLASLREALRASSASRIVHPGVPSRVHSACRETARTDVLRDDPRSVVRESDLVIACPKDRRIMTYSTPGVWAWIGAARHRGVEVKVIMPGGEVARLEGDKR